MADAGEEVEYYADMNVDCMEAEFQNIENVTHADGRCTAAAPQSSALRAPSSRKVRSNRKTHFWRLVSGQHIKPYESDGAVSGTTGFCAANCLAGYVIVCQFCQPVKRSPRLVAHGIGSCA